MTHIIPFGTTEAQDFQIWDKGVAIVGTGITPTIEVYTGQRVLVTTPVLTVAWLDQAAGKVSVTGHGALPLGTYLVRFKLTDSGGTFGYAPNKEFADVWRVVRVAAV